LLEVKDPDVLKPEQLQDESSIPTRVAGATFDFMFAFNGGNNNALIAAQGLITDEYHSSDTFDDRVGIDRRAIDRNDSQMNAYVYGGLHVARASAQGTADFIEQFDADHDDLPRLRSFQGFTEIFLGETFCSGVPVSSLDGNTLVFGQPRTTQQIFEAAVAAFDIALQKDPTYNLAKVGKGRALLNLNRPADAAAAVASVPTSFEDFVFHSSSNASQNNGLWDLANNGRLSVWNNEGTNGLNYRTANDPRVPWLDTGGLGFDQETPLYLQLVSPDIDSSVRFASGIEARLIEAEAALRAPVNRVTFFQKINQARATISLAAINDTGQSTDALVTLLFRERAFWFYSTAHRLGDMRRLIRQYGRAAETVFPTGAYPKGGNYSSDVNFPIPVEEDNNPNTSPLSQGCLNRNA
jgi:hypothetical protein